MKEYKVFELTGNNWETSTIIETDDYLEAMRAYRANENAIMISRTAGLRWTH